MRTLYDWLFVVAIPWLWLRLYLKGDRRYRLRVGERFARLPDGLPTGAIWFHAASAGETIAVAPTIQALARAMPDQRFLVTTTTPTGAERAAALLGDVATHCYLPYDVAGFVRRFVRTVRPAALLLVETELWPNLIEISKANGIPVAVVNARLSDRSYRRYRRFGATVRRMVRAIDRVFCQYPDTAARFEALGASASSLETTGSVKFDIEIGDGSLPAAIDTFTQAHRVWIAGSTHEGEENVVLEAHDRLRQSLPDARLIIVPRHPERAGDVERLVAAKGLSSGRLSADAYDRDVLIGDVMGTLMSLYGLAEVAFLGGSLDDTGGHNPIEPAALGMPMLMGPERRNFVEVCERFDAAGCLHRVDDAGSLVSELLGILGDDERRGREGAAARRVVEENRGARQLLLEGVKAWIRAGEDPASGKPS